jgi:hypothetical protein
VLLATFPLRLRQATFKEARCFNGNTESTKLC